jgi:hypothetical protein
VRVPNEGTPLSKARYENGPRSISHNWVNDIDGVLALVETPLGAVQVNICMDTEEIGMVVISNHDRKGGGLMVLHS